MRDARDFVESIRRDRGLDVPGANLLRPGSRNLRDLGNALRLLSDQLYNSDGHFLLELLQNADDNAYPDGVEPTVVIELASDGLVFRNNELGFAEAHVEAICSIGESTKRAQPDATGEKGIGFKAVFKVSDRPEVHSGDFHFCFDRTRYGNLGLVTPEWVDTAPDRWSDSGTTVILPYKPEHDPSSDLLAQIRPELLLFLRRLRRLRIVNALDGLATEYSRRDDGQVVEIVRSITTDRGPTEATFRYFRHGRVVPMGDLQDEMRPDASQTEVVVAVPIGKDGTVDGTTTQHLFAFLPVREAGLRYVTHADFILSTSREDVMRQRPWNLRLRDELGATLAEAVLAMQSDRALGRSALRVLSKPSSVADPFIRPMLERAVALLKTGRCVPVLGGDWVRPDTSLRPDTSRLSELVPAADAGPLLDKSFVDDGVTSISEALDLLNVARFQLSDLLRACGNEEWIGARPVAWFVDLYRRLEPLSKAEDGAKQLREAGILRLGDGSLLSSSEGNVFRSLSTETKYGFEDLLHVVDASVLREAEAAGYLEAVDSFLSRLGVRDATPTAVLDQYILPMHSGDGWKEAGNDVLLGHARYVRDHLDAYLKAKGDTAEAALKGVRQAFRLYTAREDDKTRYVAHPGTLYVGDAYGDPQKVRLQWLLSGAIDNLVVGADYIQGADAEERSRDAEAWVRIFRRLGVHMLPKIESSADLPSHVRPPSTQRGALTVADWLPSYELSALLTSRDDERKASLLALLDRFWDTDWARFTDCKVTRGHQSVHEASSLLEAIRGTHVRDSRGEWIPLESLYQLTENNKAVFGTGVRYLREGVSSAGFIAAAGIVAEPTVEQVLTRLAELSREAAGDKKSVQKLYQFLNQHWEGHEALIGEHFRDQSIVCVGFGEEAQWARCADCCWQVPARLREVAPVHGVDGLWPQLEDFFCEKIELRESMSNQEWVATLLKLPGAELKASDAGDRARQVYRELEEALRSEEADLEMPPDWFTPAVDGLAIRTTRGEWWRNDGDVFAADDPGLAELFDGCESVAFIDIPPTDLPRFQRLLRAFRIPRVSQAQREPLAQGEAFDVGALAERLHARWSAIARLLFFLHPDHYREASGDGRLAALREMKVSARKPLLLDVVLHDQRRKHRFECKLRGDESALELLVDAEEQENWHAIGQEIGRWLRLDDIAAFRLGGILGEKDSMIEKLLRSLRVYHLPAEEVDRWNRSTSDDVREPDAAQRSPEDDVDGLPGSEEGESADGLESSQALASDADPGPAHETDGSGEPETGYGAENVKPENVGRGASSPNAPDGGAAASAHPGGTWSGSPSTAVGGGTPAVATGGGFQGQGSPRGGVPAPPVTPDQPGERRSKPQRSPERLISYVGPPEGSARDAAPNAAAQAERERVDRAAVEYVVLKEKEEHRRPEIRDHTNPGYDIESFRVSGESDRYIEVKGLKDAWGERGVTMTSVQFAFAREHRDRSWLYVVEFADDTARRKLWRVRNSAARVSRFGFDHGWKDAAEPVLSAAVTRAELRENARWRCADGVVGTIESIKRSSMFVNIRVVRPDGTSITRTAPEDVLLRSLVEE